jgi:hypothetical protein
VWIIAGLLPSVKERATSSVMGGDSWAGGAEAAAKMKPLPNDEQNLMN